MQLWPNTLVAAAQVSVAGGVPAITGSSGLVASVEDLGVGAYLVALRPPGCPHLEATASVIGSTYGTAVAFQVSPTEICVYTYDAAGAAADRSFSVVALQFAGLSVAPILDQLSTQPLWASWLGGQLAAAHTGPLFRARRSADSATLDIGPLSNGRADVASLLAFAAGGSATLARVYNQVANAFTQIDAPSVAAEPLIVVAGAAVLGSNGYLAARFDGQADLSGDDSLSRADALGLAGDVDLTLAGDLHAENSAYCTAAGIGNDSGAGYFASDLQLATANAFAEQSYATTAYTFTGTANRPVSLWWQTSRLAAGAIGSGSYRLAGVDVPFAGTSGAGSMTFAGARSFRWGRYIPALAGAFGTAPIGGLASNIFCWSAVLSGADQAAFDAWQVGAHC